jgi:hypothetical protein
MPTINLFIINNIDEIKRTGAKVKPLIIPHTFRENINHE